MKRIQTIGLILILCISISAQEDYCLPKPKTFWQKHWKGFAITGIQLASLTLEAVGDGMMDAHRYDGKGIEYMKMGHTLKASAIGVAFLTIPMIDWERPISDGLKLAVSWGFMRYGVFDLGYNLTRGLDPLYAGTTSTHGNIISRMPPDGRVFTKGIAITVSVAINFKEF